VQLNPKHPPGRVNRKARAFEPEIARLRSEGYTCESIRAALADIGVDVSLSTVQREAARCLKRRSSFVVKEAAVASTKNDPAATPRAPALSVLAGDPRTGKEIAEAFVGKRYTNPLLLDRNNHESSRH
jgi:hypothetical protein